MTTCNLKGCPLPGQHISDCEPTHAGKLTYWGERALDLRSSMERDGLSLDEIGRIFCGAAPTLRPPPMPDGEISEALAQELNWSPLTCQLAPGHGGRHFDEATGIPWDEA